jgi:predicted TIM-barrel fold metal-dependent hydrolase
MKNYFWVYLLVLYAHLPAQDDPTNILLRNYRPISIYNTGITEIEHARFPAIDMHSHPYAGGSEEIAAWVRNMDAAGIRKTIILTKRYGAAFDSVYAFYKIHGDRFDLWCGFDLSAYDRVDFTEKAIAELERCARIGARGVGEISDKGAGLIPGADANNRLHLDDPEMDPLWEKCGELGLPVNVHVADPIWMYLPMDSTNDGLMNAYSWRLDNRHDIRTHAQMIRTLENIVKKHPNTTFIACHFANLSFDLKRLGDLLESYPNLYADISARYAETAPIPRTAAAFYEQYQDRLLYGTDMGFEQEMYRITFRILESTDEHFYEIEQFGYHWPLNGLGLDNDILEKLYFQNAARILKSNMAEK